MPHPQVYRGWGFSALFMVLGWVLFSNMDDPKLKTRNRKPESKTGPKDPTLPIHQTREGWGTQFRSFGQGWATRQRELESQVSMESNNAPANRSRGRSQGLDVREHPRRTREKCFSLLTSPFIEPALTIAIRAPYQVRWTWGALICRRLSAQVGSAASTSVL